VSKVIGLIRIIEPTAFEAYRGEVGRTVAEFGGRIRFRGSVTQVFWNELGCEGFEAVVELEFERLEDAQAWATSESYRTLLEVRSRAMRVTLFAAE
jgi:uncharacterized protein (DUF1330 family)